MFTVSEDRSPAGRKRLFHLLDGIRGTAAVVIVQRHTAWLFGTDAWPGTYLAVDLFFVLSGFVIAHSYERRLVAGWPWRHFMAARLIRLYPLYLLGVALGVLALAGHMVQAPGGHNRISTFLQACLSSLLMLPNWELPPIIGARWSLTYELVANAVYAWIVPVLTDRRLLVIIAVAAASLGLLVIRGAPIDSGFQYYQAPMALARVSYSFGIGLLLYRIHARGVAPVTFVGLVLIAVAMWIGVALIGGAGMPLVEVALILVGFPALTLLAAHFDVGGAGAQICGFLGSISYAVYVIHQPASLLFEAALRRVVGAQAVIAPYAGWAFLGLVIVGCRLLDAVYDRPVRKRLSAFLLKR